MMGKELSLQTTLLVVVMTLGTATGQGPLPNYTLTAYPHSPVDGESMTLSCTDRNGGVIWTAVWFRTGDEIFQTSSNRTSIITTVNNKTTIYRDVESRISVNTSDKQHNVTLKVKAVIDNGTVWTCQSIHRDSNNITIDIVGHKDTHLSPGFFENTKSIYIITAAAGGAVIVIVVIVVIVCVCVRKRRNKQCTGEKITEDDKQCYSHNTGEDELVMADNVLYGGYDHDINRTGPDKEEPTTKKSTGRPRVVTDAYAQVNKVKKNKKGSQFQLQQETED